MSKLTTPTPAAALRRLRLRARLTPQEMADRLGITRAHLYRLEGRRARVTARTMAYAKTFT